MDTDEALFARLCAGELRAFDALYARYEGPLLGFLRAMLGDSAEAEDALHDTFVSIMRERQAGVEVRCFRAWVYQVARNGAHNRIRSRKRSARAAGSVAVDPTLTSVARAPDRSLEERQRGEALAAAVSRLPAPLASVYRLRSEGLAYEEVAATLGIPVGTVKSRMNELVKRLREEVWT